MFTVIQILGGGLPKDTRSVPCVFTDEVRMEIERVLRKDERLSPAALHEGSYLSSMELAVMAGGRIVRLRSDRILHVEDLISRPAKNLRAEGIVLGKYYRVEYPQILPVIGYNEVPLWGSLV